MASASAKRRLTPDPHPSIKRQHKAPVLLDLTNIPDNAPHRSWQYAHEQSLSVSGSSPTTPIDLDAIYEERFKKEFQIPKSSLYPTGQKFGHNVSNAQPTLHPKLMFVAKQQPPTGRETSAASIASNVIHNLTLETLRMQAPVPNTDRAHRLEWKKYLLGFMPVVEAEKYLTTMLAQFSAVDRTRFNLKSFGEQMLLYGKWLTDVSPSSTATKPSEFPPHRLDPEGASDEEVSQVDAIVDARTLPLSSDRVRNDRHTETAKVTETKSTLQPNTTHDAHNDNISLIVRKIETEIGLLSIVARDIFKESQTCNAWRESFILIFKSIDEMTSGKSLFEACTQLSMACPRETREQFELLVLDFNPYQQLLALRSFLVEAQLPTIFWRTQHRDYDMVHAHLRSIKTKHPVLVALRAFVDRAKRHMSYPKTSVLEIAIGLSPEHLPPLKHLAETITLASVMQLYEKMPTADKQSFVGSSFEEQLLLYLPLFESLRLLKLKLRDNFDRKCQKRSVFAENKLRRTEAEQARRPPATSAAHDKASRLLAELTQEVCVATKEQFLLHRKATDLVNSLNEDELSGFAEQQFEDQRLRVVRHAMSQFESRTHSTEVPSLAPPRLFYPTNPMSSHVPAALSSHNYSATNFIGSAAWTTKAGPGQVEGQLPEQAEDFDRFLSSLPLNQENPGLGGAKEVQDAAESLGLESRGKSQFGLHGMLVSLLPHQIIGVKWMIAREAKLDDKKQRNLIRGGILADVMGLGKTMQCIATMVKNHPGLSKTKQGERLATLVVAPTAVIHQWAREIERACPGLFKVHVHHGATKIKNVLGFESHDVVITTYGTLVQSYPMQKFRQKPSAEEVAEEALQLERHKGPLFRVKWLRLILDECHVIKNPGAKASIACANLDAERSWLLSGTPLQNRVDDVYPYLRVLRVPIFSDRSNFKKHIIGKKDVAGAARLREILRPVLLRRQKDDKIDGKPIICLPEKFIEMKELSFDEDEMSLYRQVEDKAIVQINKYLADGTAVKRANSFLVILLRLRQLCIHPFLILDHIQSKIGIDALHEARGNAPGLHSLARALQFADIGNGKEVICCLCAQEAEQPHVGTCQHIFCYTCIQASMEEYTNEDADRCPTCHEDLGQLRAFDYDRMSAASIVKDDTAESKLPMNESDISADASRSPAIPLVRQGDSRGTSEPGSLPSTTTHRRFIAPPDSSEDESDDLPEPGFAFSSALGLNTQSAIDTESCVSPTKYISRSTVEVQDKLPYSKPERMSPTVKAGLAIAKLENVEDDCKVPCYKSTQSKFDLEVDSLKLPAFVMDPADVMEPREAISKEEVAAEYLSWANILELRNIPSTKFKALQDQLAIWMQMNDDKIIIFSSFTKALDLVAKICEAEEWEILRYQGNMNMQERESTLRDFEDNGHLRPGPRILLMSLKAGGVGLNLTIANKVILLDFWWNAAAELQAIDRVHRLGQSKEVYVQRMYLPKTVEERIYQLQENKLKLAGVVLGEGDGKLGTRLTLSEIMGLFGRMTTNADGVQQLVRHE